MFRFLCLFMFSCLSFFASATDFSPIKLEGDETNADIILGLDTLKWKKEWRTRC